ncbi:nitroreductase/quinone reductase family protein [Nocardia tengchongensis]
MRFTPFWLNTRAYARILKVVTRLNTWIYVKTDGRRAARWDFFGSFRKDPLPIAVLTTVGRKSGVPRTVAVVYLPLDDDRIAFAASHCGQETLPNWFRNIQRNPDVTVQIAGDKYETRARILEPGSDERKHTWSLLARKNQEFAWMQRWAEREVPVLICELSPARVEGVGIV